MARYSKTHQRSYPETHRIPAWVSDDREGTADSWLLYPWPSSGKCSVSLAKTRVTHEIVSHGLAVEKGRQRRLPDWRYLGPESASLGRWTCWGQGLTHYKHRAIRAAPIGRSFAGI